MTVLLLVVGVVPPIALAASAAPGARVVGAVYPPWWNAERALLGAASVAPVVQSGAWPFIVVVRPRGPDDVDRLAKGGAIWLIHAGLAGCFSDRD